MLAHGCTLTSRTLAEVPKDRTRTKVGVGEEVIVSIMPAESVTWSVSIGGGSVSPPSAPATAFTAGDSAGSSTVKATRADGSICTLTFNVIEPSGGFLQRKPGTGVWHIHGKPSVGYQAELFLLPDDVSFEFVEFAEGLTHAKCTGYFKSREGYQHDPTPQGFLVILPPVVPGKGSKVEGHDDIRGTDDDLGPPYSDGTFLWEIPWKFRVSGGSPKQFTTMKQLKEIDSTGKLTITKGNIKVSKELNDPTSSI